MADKTVRPAGSPGQPARVAEPELDTDGLPRLTVAKPAVCRLPKQEEMIGIIVETRAEADARRKAEADAARKGANPTKKTGTQPLSSEEVQPRRR